MAKTAGDLMNDRLVIAHWHEPVGTALGRLEEPAPAVLVVDGDRVVAVVARPMLEGWLHQAPEGVTPIHLRDRVSPPVWFCQKTDDLDAARAALRSADTGAIAVIDDKSRVVGVLTNDLLPDAHAAPADDEQAADATDRGAVEHPGLEVYAPWATVEGGPAASS